MLVPVLPNIESGKAIWSWHIKFQKIPSWLLHALIGLFHDISMPTISPKLYLQTLPLWWASTTFSPWFPAMANEPSMVRRHSRLSDGGMMERRHSQPKMRRGPLPQAGKLWENCGKHNGGVTFSADSTWFYHVLPYLSIFYLFISVYMFIRPINWGVGSDWRLASRILKTQDMDRKSDADQRPPWGPKDGWRGDTESM